MMARSEYEEFRAKVHESLRLSRLARANYRRVRDQIRRELG